MAKGMRSKKIGSNLTPKKFVYFCGLAEILQGTVKIENLLDEFGFCSKNTALNLF